jgi:multidrug resistance efflux pump
MPEDLFGFELGPDPVGVFHQQKQILARALEEEEALLIPMRDDVDRLSEAYRQVELSKAGIVKQLEDTKARLRKAIALRDLNVVYEDGIYTEQLITTLTSLVSDLERQLEDYVESAKLLSLELAHAKEELLQAQRKSTDALAGELAWVRGELNRVDNRMSAIAAARPIIEVRSRWSGVVQDVFTDNNQVRAGDRLFEIRVPSDTGVVHALLPEEQRDFVRVGQKVTAIFPLPGGGDVAYSGSVRFVVQTPNGIDPLDLELDVTIPPEGPAPVFLEGLRGRLIIETDPLPLRQHFTSWIQNSSYFAAITSTVRNSGIL